MFQFADKTLTFTHERGRAWIATLGGRKIGRVYQEARKPCWGARNFYTISLRVDPLAGTATRNDALSEKNNFPA